MVAAPLWVAMSEGWSGMLMCLARSFSAMETAYRSEVKLLTIAPASWQAFHASMIIAQPDWSSSAFITRSCRMGLLPCSTQSWPPSLSMMA